MPSPFPGMDPYLESHWRDVHCRLIIYIGDAIQDSLPRELRARVEERVVLEVPEGLGDSLYPDVHEVERRHAQQAGVMTLTRPTAAELPIVVDTDHEPLTEGYIEIIDISSGNRVVTVIEVLSPTNKTPGDDMAKYQRNQREICQSDTNLVEIDLLRGGRHVLAVPMYNIPSRQRATYEICVRRAAVPGKAEIYPIGLLQKLPAIKIPLRLTDQDVLLDLQALIEQCYRKGRYEGDIDYRQDPQPPWTQAEAKGAIEFLRGQGFRHSELQRRKKKRKPPRRLDGA